MMRFYQQPHRFYAGVDLHARAMYVCVLDHAGAVVLHRNLDARPEAFLAAVGPYRDGLVVGCECMFAWYWLADLCAEHQISFVLGHALYLKAIHGGKNKNDKLDSLKLATLLRGGTFAQAYVYPKQMRATRDLLRRRGFLVGQRAHLIAHLQNTASQYNLAPFGKKLTYAANREELQVADRFDDPAVRCAAEADLALIDALDEEIHKLESYLLKAARVHQPQAFARLRSVPGIGPVLALTILYEVHDIHRFGDVGPFLSYARLVPGRHESAGKAKGSPHRKIGNAHLKWAFGEAACLMTRHSERAKRWLARRTKKHGKAAALAHLAAKIGRTVYHLWRKEEAYDEARMFAG
jgi:transposase